MSNRRHIIQSFFSSLGGDEFMSRYWPGEPYHEDGDPERLPPVFQAPVLNDFEMLANVYRGPAFFFSGQGSVLQPVNRPPLELYRAGHTVNLGDVAPFIRGSRIFLGALEAELGVAPGCARMGVFASPQDDSAAPRYDSNDVFTVQLAGDRKINIAPVEEVQNPAGKQYSTNTTPRPFHYPQMPAGFPDPSTAEFRCMDMAPGSVLFTPRGMWHHAQANRDSVALSVIIDPAPAVDAILEQLKFSLLQDPQWRAPLYGAWDPVNDYGKRNLDDLLEDLRRAAARLTRTQVMQGGAGLGYRIDHIDERTRFQAIPTARVIDFPNGAGSVQLKVVNDDLERGRRETLDITVRDSDAALATWLASQRGQISGRDIAAHAECSFGEVSDLLKALCRGELLMPLWFDPLPSN